MPAFARWSMSIAMTLPCHSTHFAYFELRRLQTVRLALITIERSGQIEAWGTMTASSSAMPSTNRFEESTRANHC